MFDLAYAMGAPSGQGGEPAGGAFGALIPLVIIVFIFYFLLIRPQQKRQKQHRQFLNNLKRGDMVVTVGGLHGKITGLTDTVVTLEIADNLRVKVSRSYIAGSVPGHKES
ncbi:MAG TPA: preprotein translocase subunit YajC [Syntrophaceae bacterium]|nr:preprotein translocase subunit YajC [Syntrophaceae bacterium]